MNVKNPPHFGQPLHFPRPGEPEPQGQTWADLAARMGGVSDA